jgi:hypothetical protein
MSHPSAFKTPEGEARHLAAYEEILTVSRSAAGQAGLRNFAGRCRKSRSAITQCSSALQGA